MSRTIMNKNLMVLLIGCTLPATIWAAGAPKPAVIPIQKIADAMLCGAFEESSSGFAKAMQKRCSAPQRKARADFDRSADKRTLQDCIKPGNLIDDDVRKCIKGF